METTATLPIDYHSPSSDVKIIDYSKYCFLPIQYPNLIAYYDLQKQAFWFPSSIHMSTDRKDWLELSEDERKFITFILAFFAQADGLVIENLVTNFQRETSEFKEANAFYAMQNAIETIHNEVYSLLIETLIQDIDERNRAMNAIQNYPSIKTIADWMIKWMDSSRPLLERIIAFACIEGIIFNGAFCAIYWIKKKNKLNGLTKANEWIARDEAIHTMFAVALYYHYTEVIGRFPRLSGKIVHSIVKSVMEVAENFIRKAMCVELIGMDADSMIEYVKCTADHLVSSLGYEKIYDAKNPFDWMIMITLSNKTNFFEDSVSEYSHVQNIDMTFDPNAAF